MDISREQVQQATQAYLDKGNLIEKTSPYSLRVHTKCLWCFHPLNHKPKQGRKLCQSCASEYLKLITSPAMLILKAHSLKDYGQRKSRIFKDGCKA